jgi:hypothetical protein
MPRWVVVTCLCSTVCWAVGHGPHGGTVLHDGTVLHACPHADERGGGHRGGACRQAWIHVSGILLLSSSSFFSDMVPHTPCHTVSAHSKRQRTCTLPCQAPCLGWGHHSCLLWSVGGRTALAEALSGWHLGGLLEG